VTVDGGPDALRCLGPGGSLGWPSEVLAVYRYLLL